MEDRLEVRVIQPKGPTVSEARMEVWRGRIEWCKHTEVTPARPGQRCLIMPDYPQQGPPGLMVFDMEESIAHCRGRHGVIRNIPKEQWQEVQYTITYYFGAVQKRGAWWQKQDSGRYSVEFYDVTKVDGYGPDDRPWKWCGNTVLFKTWRANEEAQRLRDIEAAKVARTFRFGDVVTFQHKGEIYTGRVVNVKKRVTVMVGNSKWYVPAMDLRAGE